MGGKGSKKVPKARPFKLICLQGRQDANVCIAAALKLKAFDCGKSIGLNT